MECVMKGGYKPVIFDEICNLNSQNETTVSGEDFFVDQLLNLNDEDSIEEGENGFLVVKEEPLVQSQETNKVSAFLSPSHDFGSVLSVPAEEPDLEWLSLFVEESFSSPYPSGLGPILKKPDSKLETGSKTHKGSSFSPPPALNKSRRSKRARTGGRVWYTSLAESSSPLSSSYPSSPNPNPNPGPAMPRKERKRVGGPGFGSPRRCSHCGAQKTPQWRAGPHGLKTLCNACGVRFKSGRLLPEYRPACSPSFSSELHSNSHRKVLEMRKKKESTLSD